MPSSSRRPRHPRPTLCLLAPLLFLAACASPSVVQGEPVEAPEVLGPWSRSVSGLDPAAEHWFDRGLLWTYGFHHHEAVRCFRRAAQLDPDHPMPRWGEALALGPNLNARAGESALREAQVAAAEALALAEADPDTSAVDLSLVRAMAVRFASADLGRRRELDRAYADAMSEAFEAHPTDADVAVLLADALMNLSPWDYWGDDGAPGEHTALARRALQRALALDPDHPGAHHFWIHLTEASPDPGLARDSAARLAALAPGSGHLVHMSGHTWMRLGEYRAARLANTHAVDVDRKHREAAGPQSVYDGYYLHNLHFLLWSALYSGECELALEAATDMEREIPELRVSAHGADRRMGSRVHVLVRFGRWEEVLEVPSYGARYPYSEALRHYARGVALAALGDPAAARAEQASFERLAARVPRSLRLGRNSVDDVLAVARGMLEGEIAYREGRVEAAFDALRRAVEAEDALEYGEPAAWMQPVRHALGALLLEQGRPAEALEVYRADLRQHPQNGWALHGLAECEEALGHPAEAADARARFERAFEHADVVLSGSCYCRRGAPALAPTP